MDGTENGEVFLGESRLPIYGCFTILNESMEPRSEVLIP